jgi:orotate phosphoribosyltransferase
MRGDEGSEAKRSFDKLRRLRAIIGERSLLQNRGFVLASGRASNYFFDMKQTMFDPEGAALLADLLFDKIRDDPVEYVGGLETGAIPLVTLLCRRSWPEKPLKGFFVRKEGKGHGTDRLIDGRLERGARVILFEDVTTTGGSVMQAVERVRAVAGELLKIVTVVDRLEGAAENFRQRGIRFEALFTRNDFV